MCFLASFLNLLVTLLKVRLAHRYLRHGRKVGSSPGAPGPLIPKYPQYLRIPLTTVTPRTSGPSDSLEPQDVRTLGKLPIPFEIQNLNTQKI